MNATVPVPDEIFDERKAKTLQDSCISRCSASGFELFSDFAERHGSWELTLAKQDDLHRYISVDLTDSDLAGLGGRQYDVEVWIGAEHEQNFVRRMIGQFRSSGYEIGTPPFEAILGSLLDRATVASLSLQIGDLVERYKRTILHTRGERMGSR